MLTSFLNVWTIFLFTTIILVIYIFVYVNLFGGFTEIKWKLFYLFLSWVSTFIYLFLEIETILYSFSRQLENLLIIKDLQDLINLSVDLSFYLSFWFVLPLFLYFCWTFFLHLWDLQDYRSWSLYFLFSLYFFSIFKFFLDDDLFLASWNFFKTITPKYYDFQPDFFYIIISYLGDFFDLTRFNFFILCGFLLLFLFQGHIYRYANKAIFVYFRIIFSFFIGSILFYFFGGESFTRDCFLFLITYISLECYYFLFLFFFSLKQKKIF